MPRQVRVLLVVTVTDYGYVDDEPRDEFKPANDRDLGRLVAEQIWDDIKHGAVPVRGGVTFEPLEVVYAGFVVDAPLDPKFAPTEEAHEPDR